MKIVTSVAFMLHIGIAVATQILPHQKEFTYEDKATQTNSEFPTSSISLSSSVNPHTTTTTQSKSSAEQSGERTAASTKKPNILIILADDVGTGDIPFYWNSGLVDMPNIQKLANMGVTFKDAHSTPLCAPSRYMLLSGNYAHRGRNVNGVWQIGKLNNQFQSFQKSIAETLKEGGNYSTAMYGKWHLGGKIPIIPGGNTNMNKMLSYKDHDWTRPLIDGPQDTGFISSLVTSQGIQGPPYSYFRDGFLTTNTTEVAYWRGKRTYDMPRGTSSIIRHGEGDPDWDSTAYNMVIVNETANFIDAHMVSDRSDDPWFIYAALGAVHKPHSPPDFYLDGTPIAGTQKTKHMDMLYEMDKAVGSLVSIIEEKGLANDTIIVFTSDNGGVRDGVSLDFGHNSHGPLRGQKGDIYEGGHRVPLIFRYDGKFPVNETRSHMVGLNDIYKTLCKLTGISVPHSSAQDSKSFADYILSESSVTGLREYLPTWAFQRGSDAIRFGNMKLIRHHSTNAANELYDLDSDISEESNLLPNSKFNYMIKKMTKKLDDKGPCPKDREQFKLKRGNEKGENEKVVVQTCKFFRKKPKRCNNGNYFQGEHVCNSVCGRHKTFCKTSFGT